jgi:anaerobic selenocysteine-containing dehydrogenase
MPDTIDGRRKFLKTALVSAGAFVGALAARTAAYARLIHDPLVREMEKRVGKTPITTQDDATAALCDKASCNPGCQDGCSAGCQAACKTGNK